MVNFGSPPVGDDKYQKFSDSILKEQYRVAHYRDIVPHLHVGLLWPRYHHSGTEIYENRDGKMKICDGKGKFSFCADHVTAYNYKVKYHLHYLGHNVSACRTVASMFLN